MDASNDIWRLLATFFGSVFSKSSQGAEDFYQQRDINVATTDWLKPNTRIITETVLVCIVDNFLSYLTDLLRLLMTVRPETLLAERGKVDIRTIPEAVSLDELKKEIIEDRILSLSYKSVQDLAEYLQIQLGFEVFSVAEDRGIVVKAVETRNIVVHNRCRINQRFLERGGGVKEDIGHTLNINPSDLLLMNRYFDKLAKRIDSMAGTKFGISCLEQVVV